MAIAAFAVSICSGPLAIFIIYLGMAFVSPYAINSIGAVAISFTGIISLSVAIVTMAILERPGAPRGQKLAAAAIFITVFWAIAMTCLVQYMSDHIE